MQSISEFFMQIHWCICISLCQHHTVLITIAFSWVLKLGNVNPSTIHCYFLFKIVWTILGLLNFHVNFRVSLSISAKKPSGILPGTESIDQFEEYCYLNMKSSDPWTWNVFPIILIFLNFFQQYFIVFKVWILHLFCCLFINILLFLILFIM